MFLIFLKMGQTAVLLCFYSDDDCGHFVTISFLWPFTIREKSAALTNQRSLLSTDNKRSVLNSVLLSIFRVETLSRGEDPDLIYLMLLILQSGPFFVRQDLYLHI